MSIVQSKKQSSKSFSFSKRRMKSALIAGGATLLLGAWSYFLREQLGDHAFFTGYLLLGTIVFLTLFNMRKRLTFLPAIGSATFWMQMHIYVGFSTFAFFAFHVGWKIPDGWFELTLAALFLFVSLSGVYGLYITRSIPARLTGLAEEVIFERIPATRQQLAVEAQNAVVKTEARTDVLVRFYTNRVAKYLELPPSWAYLIYPNRRKRRQLASGLEGLHRYLGEEDREVCDQLATIINRRDELDYHYAMQGRLKIWLFAHIGVTYSLVVCGFLHGYLAHAFHGGLS